MSSLIKYPEELKWREGEERSKSHGPEDNAKGGAGALRVCIAGKRRTSRKWRGTGSGAKSSDGAKMNIQGRMRNGGRRKIKRKKKEQKREIFWETEERKLKMENGKTFIITPNESMLRSRRPLTVFWRAGARRRRAGTW